MSSRNGDNLELQDVLVIHGRLAQLIYERAERLGVTPEEYLIDLVLQDADPESRAIKYIEASRDLLTQAKKELERGNIRQAAEKLWRAAALAVKAYAYWKEGKLLVRHSELWEYKRKLEKELGDWVYDAWNAANGMHTCFYEGWCTKEDVEKAYIRVEKLVHEISARIKS